MQHFKVVKDDGFNWVIVRMKCEGEWNSVIFFLFVTFVVLTVHQFVQRGDGPFELQKQDSHVFRKTGTFFRFVRKIRAITAQSSESKKLRIGNVIFNMGWVG